MQECRVEGVHEGLEWSDLQTSKECRALNQLNERNGDGISPEITIVHYVGSSCSRYKVEKGKRSIEEKKGGCGGKERTGSTKLARVNIQRGARAPGLAYAFHL
jgi:hypothetical protein